MTDQDIARAVEAAPLRTMQSMDIGAELGSKIFVLWGGREGVETDACRRPDDAIKRLREALNYLCEYSIAQGYGYKFALEAKPNEPRADIYMPTTGAYLAFIETLDHSEIVGVNPGKGRVRTTIPFSPGGTGSPSSVRTSAKMPGKGMPAEPGLIGRRLMP